MRKALILSVAVHGGLLGLVLLALAAPRPFAPRPEQAITVEVVAPSEVPEPSAERREAAPADAQPADAKPADAQPTAVAPPAASPLAGLLDPAGILAMYNLRVPATEFDARAEAPAALTGDEVARFKAHLRRCWQRPAGLAPTSTTRVVIRVSLAPDGALADEPALIEAGAAMDGPHVMRAALEALARCQPYGFLPRERYSEWRELDVTFSARDMAGG
jgi:hypothetical protein